MIYINNMPIYSVYIYSITKYFGIFVMKEFYIPLYIYNFFSPCLIVSVCFMMHVVIKFESVVLNMGVQNHSQLFRQGF